MNLEKCQPHNIVSHAGDISCSECYDILEYLYDMYNNIIGFQCLKCKHVWTVTYTGVSHE